MKGSLGTDLQTIRRIVNQSGGQRSGLRQGEWSRVGCTSSRPWWSLRGAYRNSHS